MKAAAFLLAGVVLGFVLGGIAPRRDVVRLEREVARLERDGGGGGGLRSPVVGLAEVLRAPARERDDAASADARSPSGAETEAEATARGSSGTPSSADAPDGGVPRSLFGRRGRGGDGERDPLARFEEAAAVQRVRAVQTRAALIDQADLTDAEVAAVDEAVARMNDELEGYGEELLYLAMTEERPRAGDLLSVTHDVTAIMVRAQQDLERIVGAERGAEVEPTALEVWNYLDLDRLSDAARDAARRTRRE